MKDVVTKHGMSEATDVVVGGDSAGGLATYWSADWWQAQLPKTTRFGVAPDSGYFINTSVAGGEVWRGHMHWMTQQFNLTGSLDSSCRAAHPEDPEGCAFPNVVLEHISAPVFVMQGRVDGVMDSISGALSSPTQSGYETGRDTVMAEILDSVKTAVEAKPGQNARH